MARLVMYSSFPHFSYEVKLPVDIVTQEEIEDETVKRLRTLLGMGKITCHAEFSGDVPDVGNNGYGLWTVDILSGTGVHFASAWVRVYS